MRLGGVFQHIPFEVTSEPALKTILPAHYAEIWETNDLLPVDIAGNESFS
jgi:hypothetical protein